MAEMNRFKLGPATAYALAKAHGFEGTLEEWLESLKGDPGDPGYTPVRGVDYWTAEDIAAMKGEKGDPGKTPVRGTDYWTAADIAEIKSYVDDAILGGAW